MRCQQQPAATHCRSETITVDGWQGEARQGAERKQDESRRTAFRTEVNHAGGEAAMSGAGGTGRIVLSEGGGRRGCCVCFRQRDTGGGIREVV